MLKLKSEESEHLKGGQDKMQKQNANVECRMLKGQFNHIYTQAARDLLLLPCKSCNTSAMLLFRCFWRSLNSN